MLSLGGATALMYACQQCKEHEVINILMKNPNAAKERDRTLKTPLHYCAENANTKCAESIIKIAPELVNAQDENGYCPLHLAVIAGNKHLMKLLITKGADINIFDNEGHSAVHWAIVSNEKEALEMTINAGSNPSTPDIHGGYPLHYAVQMCGASNENLKNSGNPIKVVQTLLHYGVDVNVMDKDGRQPILWAASAGSAEAIIHLIGGGARVDASDKDGLTALHCAASRGHRDTIETLITLCGGEVDIIDGNGCSPLFYAVTLGHADSTEILLQLGAQPNRQDRKGRTAAHCGAAKGQLETLKILQKHDGNLWIRNVKGDLPFHEAVASGRKDLVLWFLSQNPDALNIGNNDGRCPLHIAAMYNNTEMIKILLDSKCLVNPVMRTSKGVLMTPLNVALCKGHRSCGKFLQLHGGVPFSKVSKLDATFIQAVRISPSHDIKNKISEKQGSAVSPSFRILPPQNDLEEAKTDSGEKKKFLRRRKKRRSHSNEKKIKSDESDSEGSFQGIKNSGTYHNSNINDLKKGWDNHFENDENNENLKKSKDLTSSIASMNNNNFDEKNKKEFSSHFKSDGTEEITSLEKSASSEKESKLLKENGSIKELKNISNLSPNDFPPTMQMITHLDSEIIEAEIDSGKIINENERMDDDSNVLIMGLTNKEHEESFQQKAVEESNKSDYLTSPSPNSLVENNPENLVKIKNDVESESEINKSRHDSDIGSSSGKNLEIQNDNLLKHVPSKGSVTESIQRNKNFEKAQTAQDYKAQKEEKSEKINYNGKGGKKNEKSNQILGGKNNGNEKSVTENNKKKIYSKNEEKSKEKDNSLERLPSISDEIVTSASKTKTSEIENFEFDAPEATNKSSENEMTATQTHVDASGTPEVLNLSKDDLNDESKTNSTNAQEVALEFELKGEELMTEISDCAPLGLERGLPLKETEIPLTSEIENKIFVQDEVVGRQEFQSSFIANEILLKDNQSEVESSKKTPEEKILSQDEEDIKNSAVKKINGNISENEIEQLAEFSKNSVENLDRNFLLKSDHTANTNDGISFADDKNISTSLKESNEDTLSAPDIHAVENFNASNPTLEVLNQNNEEVEDKEEIDVNETKSEDISSNEYENVSYKSEGKNEDAENGKAELKPSRVTRLCRRNRDLRDTNQMSVTQLVQGTIRKYHIERGIFHQLLELKRLQIRAGRANEQILVKRLVDEYERSRFYPGMKHFTGIYKFREFEKFLYDQLKAINRSHALLPDMKSYDDIDALSGILKKSRFRILSEIPQREPKCACITQRCHHTMYAYTTIPCSAYVANLRRNKMGKRKRESFLPRIDQSQLTEKEKFENRHPTLEFIQGNEKKVISLPQSFPDKGKKYYITFTIKSAQTFKNDDGHNDDDDDDDDDNEFLEETKHFSKHRHANSV